VNLILGESAVGYAALLAEFAGVPLAGVLLQELAVSGAKPVLLSDTGSVASFDSTLQDTTPNRNKRRYPEDVLASAIASGPVRERLRTRTMYGEANHPFVQDLSRQLVVDQTRVSHLITALSAPEKGLVRGRVETAATRCGRDMRGLIVENGSTVAFSMRGMGGVRKVPGRDLLEVTKPLALVTYDWVTFPSHETAYMDTLQEGYAVPIPLAAAEAYARDQSPNVRALIEQFELSPDGLRLTDDCAALVVTSGRTVMAAFLEADVRAEFRNAILRGGGGHG
jgi:hypothetical protein